MIQLLAGLVLIAGAVPTYTEDVYPILERACLECHRPDGMAPMSLATYEDARPWARAMREQVATGMMPPFHGRGRIGRYEDDPRLTPPEIRTITTWAETRAARGSEMEAVPRAPDAQAWKLGKPDRVLKAEVEPPAKGEESWVACALAEIEEDTYLASLEFRVSDEGAVHHMLPAVIEPGLMTPGETESGSFETFYEMEPEAVALSLLPGAKPRERLVVIPGPKLFALHIHFAPAEVDRDPVTVELGLRYYDGELERRPERLPLAVFDVKMGPGKTKSVTLHHVVKEDILVTDYTPHMHYRGSSASVWAETPDGRRISLVRVEPYLFDWQRTYILAEPIEVPAGSRLTQRLEWRNTKDNPNGPDWTEPVVFGPSSNNEMGSGWLGYLPKAQSATPMLIRNGRLVRESAGAR